MIKKLIVSFTICSILLSANQVSAQFVDSLHLTINKGYTVFGVSNHNCHEAHLDFGCKITSETTCFVCKHAENETDSLLMNKAQIHDSLFIHIHDKKGTIRLKYLRPHANSIIGRVLVYNKKGKLTSKEYYSYGNFHEEESPNHHNINSDKPFRAGVWEFYKNGELYKKERYELLHTKNENSYFVLVKEYTYFKGSTHVKWHKEYVVGIEELVFYHKPLKYKNPVYEVKGRKAE